MLCFFTVLRIRDVYPGSEYFCIPDPNFSIPDPHQRILAPKKLFLSPGNMILCSSRIWIRTFYPSRILDLGVTTLPFHIKNVDLLFLLDFCRQLQRRSGAAGPRTLHPSPQLLRLQRQEGDVRLPGQQCYW